MFVLKKTYKELEDKFKLLETARVPEKHEERICELEAKMAKLWNLLIEVNMKNQEKPSKFGRRFGGQLKNTP